MTLPWGLGSLTIPGLITLRSYDAHFAQVYATLPRSITEVMSSSGGQAAVCVGLDAPVDVTSM